MNKFIKVYLKYYIYSFLLTVISFFIYSFFDINLEKLEIMFLYIFYFLCFILYRVIKNEEKI